MIETTLENLSIQYSKRKGQLMTSLTSDYIEQVLSMFDITYSRDYRDSSISETDNPWHYKNKLIRSPFFNLDTHMIIVDRDMPDAAADLTIIRIYDDMTIDKLLALVEKYEKLRVFG